MFSIFRTRSSAQPRRIGRNNLERELDAVDAIAARLDHIHGYLLGDNDEIEPPAVPVRPLAARRQNTESVPSQVA